MIFAEQKPLEELLWMLAGRQRVLLLGCATCVTECAAGGQEEVDVLAPLLRLAFRHRGEDVQVQTRVLQRQCEWEFLEDVADVIASVEVVLSLGCGIGVQALSERFPEVRVLPGVNTTALALRTEPGVWVPRCAACGDCTLDETFGVCTVARCAKSLMNGPCGGTRENGMCELDEECACAWQQIVERAEARGSLGELHRVRPPKDWSKGRHGGPRIRRRGELLPDGASDTGAL